MISSMKEFHERGIKCGLEIAQVARKLHPNAISVIPLYRSCIVIEQNENERKEGICSIFAYGDPHWLRGEINEDNLKSDKFHSKYSVKFHSKYSVQGNREGPVIDRV